MDDLLNRLRAVDPPGGNEHSTRWHRNPDGPEAADRIETLEAEVERQNLAYEDLKREYDHKCERVDELRAVRRAFVRDNRDKTNRVRALEADPRMALTVEDLEDLVVHVLSQSDPDYWEKEYEIATRVGEALDAKEDDSE